MRTVFLHFFFRDKSKVSDRELSPLVEKTVDAANPRAWYYALMDYGAMLKEHLVNPSRRSTHHRRQSPFRGSDREVRGMIIRALLRNPNLTLNEMSKVLCLEPQRLLACLGQLHEEGLVRRNRGSFSIT